MSNSKDTENLQWGVVVDVRVSHLLTHLRREDHDLFLGPLGAPGERSHHEALEPGREVFVVPVAEHLVLPVPGPRVGRPPLHLHLDVDEANFAHDVCQGLYVLEGVAQRGRGVAPHLQELDDCGIVFEGAVVRLGLEVAFRDLEVPVGVQEASRTSGQFREE